MGGGVLTPLFCGVGRFPLGEGSIDDEKRVIRHQGLGKLVILSDPGIDLLKEGPVADQVGDPAGNKALGVAHHRLTDLLDEPDGAQEILDIGEAAFDAGDDL